MNRFRQKLVKDVQTDSQMQARGPESTTTSRKILLENFINQILKQLNSFAKRFSSSQFSASQLVLHLKNQTKSSNIL